MGMAINMCAECGKPLGVNGHPDIADCCPSSRSPAGSNAQLTKDQAAALALGIAEKWWNEGKISHNWDTTKDVAWLAQAIYEGKIPESI